MNNLETTLIDLAHEYGFMTVEDTLKNVVLEKFVEDNVNDPYVFMSRLLKAYSLRQIANNYMNVHINGRGKQQYTSQIISIEDSDEFTYTIIKVGDFYYKITAETNSYSDVEYKSWKVVTPTQKTITVYE
jgi:hypothetical protein